MSFLFQENNSTQASDFNFSAKGVTVWRAISICFIGIISFSRVLKRQVHLSNVNCRGMRQGSIASRYCYTVCVAEGGGPHTA